MEINTQPLLEALCNVVEAFKLDQHPFINRFAQGSFSQEAIRWWAIKMLPGSNRFNQAFLRVASQIDDYYARVIMLRNIHSEHGELNEQKAHVKLFMNFMQGIDCARIDIHEDDGAFTVPELRFKRFEVQESEPVIWSLGRFAAIEIALPSIFGKYITGLRKVFPKISDQTLEYFFVHCELDPSHTNDLLEVASIYLHSEREFAAFCDGARDMLLSISDMFTWMGEQMASGDVTIDPIPHQAEAARKEPWVAHLTLYGDDAMLYDKIYYKDQLYLPEVDFICAQLEGVSDAKVLDLCAGTGSHAKLLTDRKVRVVGVDRSAAMLAIARRKAPDAQFIEGDVREFVLSQRFDAVTCMFGALHYIEAPQDIVCVLRRAFEHLRPGGVLILNTRDRENLPEYVPGKQIGELAVRKFYLQRRGVNDSDLYVVSAYDLNTGQHYLEAHNMFHTDPHRISGWVRMVGFENVRLHAFNLYPETYNSTSGEDRVVIVANRPKS